MERRRIKDRLSSVKKELASLANKKAKEMQKNKGRTKVALIGYTNAGKTALLNALADLELESHDRLFETLSTSGQEVVLSSGQRVTFLDTIGFISRLPHELIDSFKSTLEEIKTATILVHIRDISHPGAKEQRNVVLSVLNDVMGLDIEKSRLRYVEVLNKVDLLNPSLMEETVKREREGKDYPVIDISATLGRNVTRLKNVLTTMITEFTGSKAIIFPIKYEEAEEKLKWLREHAEMSQEGIEHDEATGQLRVKAVIDQDTLNLYSARFKRKRN
eukprot:TRINITY_DN10525_c0_g4_i1.p1 TRINITY_DN10525_c0_g4~~TRINITY_DN10525_c0_g4_i1.p1  ORF type:complete len:275 (-),score=84.45 TRINITY_DN10525_c0_g4_i1:80-904(-)